MKDGFWWKVGEALADLFMPLLIVAIFIALLAAWFVFQVIYFKVRSWVSPASTTEGGTDDSPV